MLVNTDQREAREGRKQGAKARQWGQPRARGLFWVQSIQGRHWQLKPEKWVRLTQRPSTWASPSREDIHSLGAEEFLLYLFHFLSNVIL